MTTLTQPTDLGPSRSRPSFDEARELPRKPASSWLAVAFAATIFTSAFLLFQIQPIISKFILPWFGGMPSVWTTCVLFFQVLLFAGYAYAHLSSTYLRPRGQAILHAALLLGACLALPIVPALTWKPVDSTQPALRIVLLLSATVGVPFFVLSSTGPLLQNWFGRTHQGRSPYRLYALSNVGSLLALISYPVVFDLLFPLRFQAGLWSAAFALFAVLCTACAVAQARRSSPIPTRCDGVPLSVDADESLTAKRKALWFVLAMVPSILLLATTNQVCLDVASVPFLWVLPLTLYLLSFILCFDSDRWYSRRYMLPCAVASMVAVYAVLLWATAPLLVQVAVYFSALFFWAMVCHGELVRLKPPARRLTSYYLFISAGGAAGGVFVGIIAPLIFKDYYELHVGLFSGAVLMLVLCRKPAVQTYRAPKSRLAELARLAVLGTICVGLGSRVYDKRKDVVDQVRNFYGVLMVRESAADYDNVLEPTLALVNGRVWHGFEFQKPELQDVPTTYYAPPTGIGRVLSLPSSRPRRVGIVGLGIGTLAVYARPEDHYTFFEINSKVDDLARKHFQFLPRCKGKLDVVIGDARLTLERSDPLNLDVLVLDAFTSDAIPVHLLTVEAFDIYRRHLAPNGMIAIHISSRHFKLRPVVDALAEAQRMSAVAIATDYDSRGGSSSNWMLLANDQAALQPFVKYAEPTAARRVLWTDDHSSLLEVLF